MSSLATADQAGVPGRADRWCALTFHLAPSKSSTPPAGRAASTVGPTRRVARAVGWEKIAILAFYFGHPLEGYGRVAFMMLDANIVAVSPLSVSDLRMPD